MTIRARLPNIAFLGHKGAGKDYAGTVLLKKYGYRRTAFADLLKFHTGLILEQLGLPVFPRGCVLPTTLPSHLGGWEDVAEHAIAFCNRYKHADNFRSYLQVYGTELVRDYVQKDFWIDAVIEQVQRQPGPWVLTDCRYPNEAEALRQAGFVLVGIKTNIPENDQHASETSYKDIDPDCFLFNNFTRKFDYDVANLVSQVVWETV